jgi:proteasome accessory factor B
LGGGSRNELALTQRHLVAVWNPSYEADAMDQHLSVLLANATRYRKGECEDNNMDITIDDDEESLEDLPPSRPLTTSEQKLQRWVDLLAALLLRQRPATFDELAKDVPGYDTAGDKRESVLRTFERDKDELRRFGVPIETTGNSEDDTIGYRLDRKAFYLPFLMIASHERAGFGPPKGAPEGYRALQTLAFEPDELDVIIEAASRVRSLGDPKLASEAEVAIRKLALDLPLGTVLDDSAGEQPGHATIVPPRAAVDPPALERLTDALTRRKTVTFDYHAMERDERSRREVQPYGLFFVSSHWYLAGRDMERQALRNFRLSRVSRVDVNKQRPQSPDYEVPADFSLREHARSREAWEIGESDAVTAVVEFTALTGTTHAALALGQSVEGSRMRRAFTVRRIDAFARWLLSFGGDARPVEPAELRAEYDRMVAATLACYAGQADD